MNRAVALPFLVLPDEVIRFGGWMIGDPGQPLQPVAPLLENWDYTRDLETRVTVSIDWPAAASALKLPLDRLRLEFSLVAGTGKGGLPRRQHRLSTRIVDQGSSEIQLVGVVRGSELSGRLSLSMRINLEAGADGDVLSPRSRGSRLWESRCDVLLEDGGDSRFPVETASFSQVFHGRPQERSPWVLLWQPGQLHADFGANVRLYVNSDVAEVLQRFAKGDRPTLQAIMGDVMSQMIGVALDRDDLKDVLNDCEEGSVGRQIQKWLDYAFPGQNLAAVRAQQSQNPGAFRAAILAASEMVESQA